MIELFYTCTIILTTYAHPLSFFGLFIAGILIYKSGFKYTALTICLSSLAVIVTTVMAWVTTSTEAIEETSPNGVYTMHFKQSIWEQIQYPAYTWAILIISISILILAVQLLRKTNNGD